MLTISLIFRDERLLPKVIIVAIHDNNRPLFEFTSGWYRLDTRMLRDMLWSVHFLTNNVIGSSNSLRGKE